METTHEDDAHGSQSAALEHPYVLTDDQVRAFFFDGWLQIPDFYSPDTVRFFLSFCDVVCRAHSFTAERLLSLSAVRPCVPHWTYLQATVHPSFPCASYGSCYDPCARI
jgi:hypothetical protein